MAICRVDFLAGQYFDIRLEVHSPVNGSEARIGEPDENFTFTIAKKGNGKGKAPVTATEYFKIEEPELEKWDFTWFEGNGLLSISPWRTYKLTETDRFAQDADKPSLVNVTSKIYRRIALYEPGEYEATLTYYGEQRQLPTGLFVISLPSGARRTSSCSSVMA